MLKELLFKILLILNIFKCECQRPKQIKMGLVQPLEGEMGFEQTGAAAVLAIQDAQSRGLLNGTEVIFVPGDDGCNGKQALGLVSDLRYEDNVTGYIGLPCSTAAVDAAKLVGYWNMSWFAFASAEMILADTVTYNTLVRLMSPYDRLATALVRIFSYYKWNLAAMVSLDWNECTYLAEAISDVFSVCNITLSQNFKYGSNTTSDDVINGYLDVIVNSARVVLLCGPQAFIRKFMLIAQKRGMTNGEYVYISTTYIADDNFTQPWATGKKDDELAKKAYRSLFQMALSVINNSTKANDFMKSIPDKMIEFFNYTKTKEKGLSGSKYSLFLYDATYLFAILTEEMLNSRIGDEYGNGSAIFELARNKNFEGISGRVVIDFKCDRIMDYKLWYLSPTADEYTGFILVPLMNAGTNATRCTEWLNIEFYDDGLMVRMPSDSPGCGFRNELCPSDPTIRNEILIAVSIAVAFLIIMLVVTHMVYRRQKFEEDVNMKRWKVNSSDITLISAMSRSQGSFLKMPSSISNTDSPINIPSRHLHMTELRVGFYNGMRVVVKSLDHAHLHLSRQYLLELKAMRDLRHENLNQFVGLCDEPHNISILTEYCPRASLQDKLQDELVKLDQNFRRSFIGEIIKGMEYLHKSPLKFHGRLKSTNVLLDCRWVVKITDYGLVKLRKNQYDTENEKYSSLLWTAPELLRSSMASNITPKIDVYSFAIIIHEIIYRQGPFSVNEPSSPYPEEIIEKVRGEGVQPYRPLFSSISDGDLRLMQLAKDCWEEDPNNRPDFTSIRVRFNSLYRERNHNIMDNMLMMMEKYANNLEDLVEERTEQLLEEKKKTDVLLYSMIPAIVADKLKTGTHVEPEFFEEVSVYFSDIVSFTRLAAESSPMEVVNFLNDLYTMFDDVISKYRVYKVETIGDAYMVASGVPIRCIRHASEIADMALCIRHEVSQFHIRHRPSKRLECRIGIHSGPVVAGVVGLTMPRYCLFGDTVNTASRMESSGKAMCIQMSQQLYFALEKTKTLSSYVISERGLVELKGKGLQMTYWLEDAANGRKMFI